MGCTASIEPFDSLTHERVEDASIGWINFEQPTVNALQPFDTLAFCSVTMTLIEKNSQDADVIPMQASWIRLVSPQLEWRLDDGPKSTTTFTIEVTLGEN